MMGVKAWSNLVRGDSMTARLTLIAHAATEAQRRTTFPLDEPIPDQEVAKVLGLNWVAPRAEHLWAAPEQRTQQTAGILALQATTAEQLRDCDYGSWRGRAMDQVESDDPEGIVAWLADPRAAPHGGESIENLLGRVGNWMDEQRDCGHSIAVTHPSVIRAAIINALHIPAQTFWRFDIAPLSCTELRFSRNTWTVRCVGCPIRMTRQAGEEVHRSLSGR
jgi:broad specificity phosphatase PhoE